MLARLYDVGNNEKQAGQSSLLCNPKCVFERGEVNRAVPKIAGVCVSPGFLSAVGLLMQRVCVRREGIV